MGGHTEWDRRARVTLLCCSWALVAVSCWEKHAGPCGAGGGEGQAQTPRTSLLQMSLEGRMFITILSTWRKHSLSEDLSVTDENATSGNATYWTPNNHRLRQALAHKFFNNCAISMLCLLNSEGGNWVSERGNTLPWFKQLVRGRTRAQTQLLSYLLLKSYSF